MGEMRELSTSQAIYVALAGGTLLMSVLGNLCVIIVIIKNKDMRTATNLFICNLAVSDLFMGGILLPQNIHDISHTADYDEGLFLCKVVTALPLFCITASIYSLVAMAVERYRAICTSAGTMNIRTAKKIMVLIWIWSFLVVIPTSVEYEVYRDYFIEPNTTTPEVPFSVITTDLSFAADVSTGRAIAEGKSHGKIMVATTEPGLPYIRICGNVHSLTFGLVNGLFLFIASYFVPLIIITVSYAKVGYFIVVKTKEQSETQRGKKGNFSVSKNKVRILKMLIMVALLFAISWCPYFVILLTSKITGQDGTGEASSPMNLLKLSLSIFSVTYNVYLYVAYTASFRNALKNLLCPCLGKTRIVPEGSTARDNNSTAQC